MDTKGLHALAVAMSECADAWAAFITSLRQSAASSARTLTRPQRAEYWKLRRWGRPPLDALVEIEIRRHLPSLRVTM